MITKRILFLLLVSLLVFSIPNAYSEAVIKVGLDTRGEHEADLFGFERTDDVEDKASVSAEFTSFLDDHVGLGLGATYQFPRERDGLSGEFRFIPVYGLLKLRAGGELKPYAVGQAGINFLKGDDAYEGRTDLEGGFYYGLGVGLVIMEGLQVEALYSVNNATADGSLVTLDNISLGNFEADIEYRTITFSVGLVF